MGNRKTPSRTQGTDISVMVTTPLSWLFLLGFAVLAAAVVVWSFLGSLPETLTAQGWFVSPETGIYSIHAGQSGTVVNMYFAVGDRVYRDDILLQLETPEGERVDIRADQTGYVQQILRTVGDPVRIPDDEVMRLRPEVNGAPLVAVCYVSVRDFKKIDLDGGTVRAEVMPLGADGKPNGTVEARVINVGTRAANSASRDMVIYNMAADLDDRNGAVVAVTCELGRDPNSEDGYYWSTLPEQQDPLTAQMPCKVRITVREIRPIDKLLARAEEAGR